MTELKKNKKAEIVKKVEEGARALYIQIQKEHNIANELADILLSYDLSAQEQFNVVQHFKTTILGDIPLYS